MKNKEQKGQKGKRKEGKLKSPIKKFDDQEDRKLRTLEREPDTFLLSNLQQ